MKSITTNQLRLVVGDIFSVLLESKGVKYFQFVANDKSQLNSSVIRVFKKEHQGNEEVNVKDILKDQIDFHAHVFLRKGVKLGCWNKVGNIPEVASYNGFFRNSSDYGNPKIKNSQKWYIWKINEPHIYVGKLERENRKSEIGIVVNPHSVVARMSVGEYDFFYPSY